MKQVLCSVLLIIYFDLQQFPAIQYYTLCKVGTKYYDKEKTREIALVACENLRKGESRERVKSIIDTLLSKIEFGNPMHFFVTKLIIQSFH